MRIVFMGTPDFAVWSLKALIEAGHEIAGVITQPDRPKGRGRQLTPPPVKEAAVEAGLAVFQPEKIKSPEFVEILKRLSPELIVVAAFGQLLSKEILELPDHGCINVHASLLPKYRGAAPIHWAVINGETETGITIMQMDEGLDSGDIVLMDSASIDQGDNTGIVHDKLAELGAQLLVKAVELISSGQARRIPQEHDKANYAPLLNKSVERIDWSLEPEGVYNLIRGLNPWPGAFTVLGDKTLKVWQAAFCSTEMISGPVINIKEYQPGTVLGKVPGTGFAVRAGNGCIALTEVQLQGSKRMRAEDFMHGHNIVKGTQLQ